MNTTRKAALRNLPEGNGHPPAALPGAARKQDPAQELAALRKELAALQHAVAEAAQIQRKICAPREMRCGEFEIAGEMFPVRHLSGDFLKVLDLGSAVGLVVGDVAGKGISAGLWVPHMVGLARMNFVESGAPAAAMRKINRELLESGPEPPMAGLFLGKLDPLTGELTYCNAGQPPALLLRRDGELEKLNAGGPMVGALPNAVFESGTVVLEPGDTLIASTDGVVECRNTREDEFGMRRLTSAATAAEGVSASQRLFSTLGATLDFGAGRPLEDDLTLLVVHRRERKAAA